LALSMLRAFGAEDHDDQINKTSEKLTLPIIRIIFPALLRV